jgi:anti-sigma factor RsiW
MIPERARVLLHAYLDHELDAASALELEAEINRQPALRHELTRLRSLQTRTREVGYFEAPNGLKERVFASFPTATEEARDVVPAWWRSWAFGSSAIAAALLVWAIGITFFSPQRTSHTVEDVVSAHIRSLMADHLTDLASSERHTVKPWLSGRLDFAPTVPDLSSEGFSLLGGRLDYLYDKAVAAVVYQHRRHVINVFIWPAPNAPISSDRLEENERGYNTVRFAARGMNYWLVSDVNRDDLRRLADLLSREH